MAVRQRDEGAIAMSNPYNADCFPGDKTLEREARSCPMLAYCPDRTFSFCLKKWIDHNGELMFRKVTFKHCYECQHGID